MAIACNLEPHHQFMEHIIHRAYFPGRSNASVHYGIFDRHLSGMDEQVETWVAIAPASWGSRMALAKGGCDQMESSHGRHRAAYIALATVVFSGFMLWVAGIRVMSCDLQIAQLSLAAIQFARPSASIGGPVGTPKAIFHLTLGSPRLGLTGVEQRYGFGYLLRPAGPVRSWSSLGGAIPGDYIVSIPLWLVPPLVGCILGTIFWVRDSARKKHKHGAGFSVITSSTSL